MKVVVTGGSGFIGTNLIDQFRKDGYEVKSVDRVAPQKEEHQALWTACDIEDEKSLTQIIKSEAPDAVIHLAARTDTDSNVLAEYSANIKGTENVLTAIDATPSVKRSVITSTQFVIGPGRDFSNPLAYSPHTVYGESKVQTEELTRNSNLASTWTLIRPVNIWGPWHARYPKEFWYVLAKGRYVHPGTRPVTRCYGYVGNVIAQIDRILQLDPAQVDRKTFYVGDSPIHLMDWVEAFSVAITGKPPRVIPSGIVRSMALVGDGLKAVGIPSPIFSSRYRSMCEDYLTPIDETFPVLGPSPISMQEGVRTTTEWLKTLPEYKGLIKGSQ